MALLRRDSTEWIVSRCPSCGGDGQSYIEDMRCGTCYGSGEITSRWIGDEFQEKTRRKAARGSPSRLKSNA
jgi:DnaJ-class molecular chaperone